MLAIDVPSEGICAVILLPLRHTVRAPAARFYIDKYQITNQYTRPRIQVVPQHPIEHLLGVALPSWCTKRGPTS